MGFEIPVDVDYFEHPKTVMLIGLIGPHADVFPLRLWRWCALYARDGFIKGGRAQIESAVKWTGNQGQLHKALIRCGFIEKDGKTVHDWQLHIGRSIHLYEQKKLRQRQKYAAGILPEENGRIPPIPSHTIQDEKYNPPLPPKGGRKSSRKREYGTDAEEAAAALEKITKSKDGEL